MYQHEDLFNLVIENLKRFVLPEEFLALDLEMSKQELFVIIIVDRLGEITMSQLSDQMNFPMSTATGIVDRLVKKGYLQRGRSESDRRIVTITLTEKGKTFKQQIKTNILGYIERAFRALDEDEKQYLFKIFTKIIAEFQKPANDAGNADSEQKQVKKISIE